MLFVGLEEHGFPKTQKPAQKRKKPRTSALRAARSRGRLSSDRECGVLTVLAGVNSLLVPRTPAAPGQSHLL